ncbi:MAG: bifunctional oligoribonuclease/PAP phosphatase NrnA [Promethearchaeota archaeon]
MLSPKFRNLLGFIEDKKVLITTHNLVDIDGLASCYALKYFINQYFDNPTVSIFFSEFSKPTKEFMKKFSDKFREFKFSYEKDVILSNFDVCLILDTNKVDQTALNKDDINSKSRIPIIFIDHHYKEVKKDNDTLFSEFLIFDNFSSTVEILLELFENYDLKLNLPIKFLIIAAIITDTGYFRYGNNRTIKNVGKLLDSDLNLLDIYLILENWIDLSERIAIIKGLQRVKLHREGDYLIGITNVSSYGASVASTLIKIGFDISIVYSKEKVESIITIRARKNICLETGLHLGKILEEISEYCQGSGGGHDGAASLTYKMEVKHILDKIIEKIKHVLN